MAVAGVVLAMVCVVGTGTTDALHIRADRAPAHGGLPGRDRLAVRHGGVGGGRRTAEPSPAGGPERRAAAGAPRRAGCCSARRSRRAGARSVGRRPRRGRRGRSVRRAARDAAPERGPAGHHGVDPVLGDLRADVHHVVVGEVLQGRDAALGERQPQHVRVVLPRAQRGERVEAVDLAELDGCRGSGRGTRRSSGAARVRRGR
jgi:hypothetical protein